MQTLFKQGQSLFGKFVAMPLQALCFDVFFSMLVVTSDEGLSTTSLPMSLSSQRSCPMPGLMVTERNWLDVYPYTKWGGNDSLPHLQESQTFMPSHLLLKEVQCLDTQFLCYMEQQTAGSIHQQLTCKSLMAPSAYLAFSGKHSTNFSESWPKAVKACVLQGLACSAL